MDLLTPRRHASKSPRAFPPPLARLVGPVNLPPAPLAPPTDLTNPPPQQISAPAPAAAGASTRPGSARRPVSGDKVRVSKLSGCSAVFFFHTDDSITAAHVQLGQDPYKTRSVSRNCRNNEAVLRRIVTCSQNSSTENDIHDALGKDLILNEIQVSSPSYSYNHRDRTERHAFQAEFGSSRIEQVKYNC
ncbi:hypothetical protein PspLS_09836 [Pyricularia sp. CBS 133598]|nr:hypothetical protein PspLS_09836 [Pyricularia sp. CBS 133598]